MVWFSFELIASILRISLRVVTILLEKKKTLVLINRRKDLCNSIRKVAQNWGQRLAKRLIRLCVWVFFPYGVELFVPFTYYHLL